MYLYWLYISIIYFYTCYYKKNDIFVCEILLLISNMTIIKL